MKIKRVILWLPGIFLMIAGCQDLPDWDLERRNFLEVGIGQPEMMSLDSFRLSGMINTDGLKQNPVSNYGFAWSTDGSLPVFSSEKKYSFGGLAEGDDGNFSRVFKFDLHQVYTAAAFIQDEKNGKIVFSDTVTFATGSGMVKTTGINYISGNEAKIEGHLEGTKKGFIALEHGFCWSSVNPLPTLSDDFFDLGVKRDDTPFYFNIDSLKSGEKLFVRAFARIRVIGEDDNTLHIIYDHQALEFNGDLYTWQRISDLGMVGDARADCFAFSIGEKVYVGGGRNGSGVFKEFWVLEDGMWTQIIDFPGGPRFSAVGFSIGAKGYAGGGASLNGSDLEVWKDFYEYDPSTNAWTPKSDLPAKRFNAVALGIGSKGYLGTGQDENTDIKGDFWEYNPNDTWSILDSLPARYDAVGFSIGSKAYIGTGVGLSGGQKKLLDDFWEYDVNSKKWSQIEKFMGGSRTQAVGFSIGNRGFVGTGIDDRSFFISDFYEYEPSTNTWIRKLDVPLNEPVRNAVGVGTPTRGYIGTGNSLTATVRFFYEFDPD